MPVATTKRSHKRACSKWGKFKRPQFVIIAFSIVAKFTHAATPRARTHTMTPLRSPGRTPSMTTINAEIKLSPPCATTFLTTGSNAIRSTHRHCPSTFPSRLGRTQSARGPADAVPTSLRLLSGEDAAAWAAAAEARAANRAARAAELRVFAYASASATSFRRRASPSSRSRAAASPARLSPSSLSSAAISEIMRAAVRARKARPSGVSRMEEELKNLLRSMFFEILTLEVDASASVLISLVTEADEASIAARSLDRLDRIAGAPGVPAGKKGSSPPLPS